MAKLFKTISEVQKQLKGDIKEALEDDIAEAIIRVVEKYLQSNVYDAYIPQGEFAYDRTYELRNAVVMSPVKVGNKYAKFEVYMDSDLIDANVIDDNRKWNQHASVDPIDVSEYIPMWVEEGTNGSLWDREGAHYMADSYFDLSDGSLAKMLANELRSRGWKIINVN